MVWRGKKIFLICLVFAPLLAPLNIALAHQPNIVNSRMTEIVNPEISQAFYGKLTGEPHFFKIKTDGPFSLYANVLIPDIYGKKEAISADIFKDIDEKENKVFVALLNGNLSGWRLFYEPFGGDSYWQGPEFAKSAEKGIYTIRVFNSKNQGKYVLAVGEKEEFKIKDAVKTLKLLPQLKKDYFDKPWPAALFNYVGLFLLAVFILFLAITAAIIWLAKRIF